MSMSMLRTAAARSLRASNVGVCSSSSRSVAAAAPLGAAMRSSGFAASPRCSNDKSSIMRQFHNSRAVNGSGESDAELSSRLAQEISYEKETASQYATEGGNGEPGFLADFKKAGVWKIEDQAGSDEIALVRGFGNEHIRILFSIGDIDTSEEEEATEEMEARAFPVRCAITISKPKQGALTIDAQAVDGTFSIENISFYKDSKLATDLTAEADWARRGLYIGPQFETLDESVQAQFESFLEERGISTELALFIPNFAEYKEQKEYCSWLENVKAFVDV